LITCLEDKTVHLSNSYAYLVSATDELLSNFKGAGEDANKRKLP